MASNNDILKKKCDWPDQHVLILCNLLNKYIEKHGRNYPFKWAEDLQPVFEKATHTKLNNYKALKNKYDGMRKDYNLWKSLKNGETGLGWNESTGQLNCSDEWWNKKIKENPNVKVIRKKQPSLELQEAWNQLFGDAVASGTDCVAPSMNESHLNDMPNVVVDDGNMGTRDNVAMGDDVETGDDVDVFSPYPQDSSRVINLENEHETFFSTFLNLASDGSLPDNIGGSDQSQHSSKIKSKVKPVKMKGKKKESGKKRESAGAAMFKQLITQQSATQQRVLELLESDSSMVNQSRDFSIGAVVSLIDRMVDDGIMTKGSELWCFSMILFEDAGKRELFLSLSDDAARLAWINYRQNVGN